jgi:CMP-N,N'-diacetyllegionaminic acid synthase
MKLVMIGAALMEVGRLNIICVIGARGGSKGVLGKNIRPLLGKPMIAWSIEQALECREISRVVVSTDSPDIAAVARQYGADVPFMRPAELATDGAGKWQVWQHALESCERHYSEKFDLYVDLDCTSPLRDVEDIHKAIEQFNTSDVDAIFSVCESRKNPYFNMVENVGGCLRVSKPQSPPLVCRQQAPKVLDHVASIYVLKPDYIRNGTGLLSGCAQGYDIGPHKGIDVDCEFDFELIEYLMRKKLTKII